MNIRLLYALAALLFAASCGQSEGVRLYTLSNLGDVAAKGADARTIGVDLVGLASYLDRPQLVVRLSPHRVNVAEFDRWAEPLKDTAPRVVANNLSALLGNDDVYTVPRSRRTAFDLSVEIDISRFEPTDAGNAILDARWAVYRPDGAEPVAAGRTQIAQRSDASDDYEAQVRLLSEALGRMSEEIASAIVGLP